MGEYVAGALALVFVLYVVNKMTDGGVRRVWDYLKYKAGY